MTKHTFVVDIDDFVDFQLYGLVSNLNEAAVFAFNTNLKFEMLFSRIQDISILMAGEEIFFPVFEWEDSQNHIDYFLIRNQGYTAVGNSDKMGLDGLFDVSPPLLQSFSQYNYLLKVHDGEGFDLPIQENSFIQKIDLLNLDKIKNIDYLIF